jgi:uncharacterized protein (TIGR02453 family)
VRYFDDETFAFLRELKKHNDREWFAKNKDRYEEHVKEPLLQFISDSGPELRRVSGRIVADPRPTGGSMFRIYRDVRFSKQNRPVKGGARSPGDQPAANRSVARTSESVMPGWSYA